MLAWLSDSIAYEDVAAGARFLWELPGFLRHPISLEEARATLRRRLERREADFLALAKWAIYQHGASPYRRLLDVAGCEYGDLARLVGQEGVEGTLRALFRQGVYLTVDEFKGRRPVVRGGTTFQAGPARLRNPGAASHVPTRSGGSRGTGTTVRVDLAGIRDRAVNVYLALDARGGTAWSHALWGVPGGAAVGQLLLFSRFGAPPVRWFSQVDPASPGLHARYRWSAHLLRWGGVLAGLRLPRPIFVPVEEPLPIASWITEILGAGGVPCLTTFASSAARLCRAALDAGLDLSGARFRVSGEPLTTARLAAIRRAGAEAEPVYASTECGATAYGCLAPEAPDDVHLFHDLHALVQPGPDPPDGTLPPHALLISSLRPTAPFILLNVSLGDHAVVTRRACGCPLERLGWPTHLHTVRSFEKLTAGGMTFPDTEIIRVLEAVLPARFGGGPTDYQLVEAEAEDGQAIVRLLVDPSVGPIDEQAVAETFLTSIGTGSGVERIAMLQWRKANLLRVERRVAHTTATGKIQHLHQDTGASKATVAT